MAGRAPLILVTRPQPQADEWVHQLHAAGCQASPLPLIDIAAPQNLEAVHFAWASLGFFRLVIMVSPNAAQAFIRHRPPVATWPPSTWVAAPGPGTVEALLRHLAQAGLAAPTLLCPPQDSPQFDSEHLWPLLAPLHWTEQRVLIVSGGQGELAQGRNWLSTQLQAAGASVETVVAYSRQAAVWTDQQQRLAAQAYQWPASHPWLFSSSEAITYLLDKQGPPPVSAIAIATHPRIAETARLAGFTRVLSVSPRLDALVGLLRSTGLDTIHSP